MNKVLKTLIATLIIGAPILAYASLKSANVLEFNSDGVLFVGDSISGKIYAFETESAKNAKMQQAYNIYDFDEKAAALLGTTPQNILVKDLAVHPQSKEAYVAISRITGDSYRPVIVATDQSGTLRIFDTTVAPSSSVQIKNAPAKSFKFYDTFDVQELTFTDIDYKNGKLYVSGLSNSDFASTLRVIDYPFSGEQVIANVEIYHANHGQKETRAPIRTLEIVTLSGKDHLLAAYTCTPLVTIPLNAITNGAHISGKTIAELGYGNTPIDLIQFTAEDMQKNKFDVVFINNKNQMAQVIPIGAIDADNQKPGIESFQNFKRAGTQAIDVPFVGALQVDEQDGYHLLAVRRNIENGRLELVSVLKNLYMRLSDFQSEYAFPGFKYPKGSEFIQNLQNMMKKDEGFPHLVEELEKKE